jgi:hypothetical protein
MCILQHPGALQQPVHLNEWNVCENAETVAQLSQWYPQPCSCGDAGVSAASWCARVPAAMMMVMSEWAC